MLACQTFTDHINLVWVLTCAWFISCHIWSSIVAFKAITYCRPSWCRVTVARTVGTRFLVPYHVLVWARGTGCIKDGKRPNNKYPCMNSPSMKKDQITNIHAWILTILHPFSCIHRKIPGESFPSIQLGLACVNQRCWNSYTSMNIHATTCTMHA